MQKQWGALKVLRVLSLAGSKNSARKEAVQTDDTVQCAALRKPGAGDSNWGRIRIFVIRPRESGL